MALPKHKTKIVCTIGPVSESPAVLKQMIEAGTKYPEMNHRMEIIDLIAAAGKD
jgi:pyruvate kinase